MLTLTEADTAAIKVPALGFRKVAARRPSAYTSNVLLPTSVQLTWMLTAWTAAPCGIDHSSTGLPYGWLEHRGTTSAPLLGCILTQEGQMADIRHQEDELSCTHAKGDSDAK
jgi:hypothetical protein